MSSWKIIYWRRVIEKKYPCATLHCFLWLIKMVVSNNLPRTTLIAPIIFVVCCIIASRTLSRHLFHLFTSVFDLLVNALPPISSLPRNVHFVRVSRIKKRKFYTHPVGGKQTFYLEYFQENWSSSQGWCNYVVITLMIILVHFTRARNKTEHIQDSNLTFEPKFLYFRNKEGKSREC